MPGAGGVHAAQQATLRQRYAMGGRKWRAGLSVTNDTEPESIAWWLVGRAINVIGETTAIAETALSAQQAPARTPAGQVGQPLPAGPWS